MSDSPAFFAARISADGSMGWDPVGQKYIKRNSGKYRQLVRKGHILDDEILSQVFRPRSATISPGTPPPAEGRPKRAPKPRATRTPTELVDAVLADPSLCEKLKTVAPEEAARLIAEAGK